MEDYNLSYFSSSTTAGASVTQVSPAAFLSGVPINKNIYIKNLYCYVHVVSGADSFVAYNQYILNFSVSPFTQSVIPGVVSGTSNIVYIVTPTEYKFPVNKYLSARSLLTAGGAKVYGNFSLNDVITVHLLIEWK
jgi:hypothetical protein